jgi:hypothetical protein
VLASRKSAVRFLTKKVYRAEIFPLSSTGMVMTFLWLPDQHLVLDSGWETIL